MIRVKVTKSGKGVAVLQKEIRRIIPLASAAAKGAAEFLLEESKKLIPVDTTTLRNDGHVRMASAGPVIIAIVGYGTYGVKKYVESPTERKWVWREPSKYAVYLHEWPKPKHKPPTQIEFLATPLKTQRFEILQIFNQIMKVP